MLPLSSPKGGLKNANWLFSCKWIFLEESLLQSFFVHKLPEAYVQMKVYEDPSHVYAVHLPVEINYDTFMHWGCAIQKLFTHQNQLNKAKLSSTVALFCLPKVGPLFYRNFRIFRIFKILCYYHILLTLLLDVVFVDENIARKTLLEEKKRIVLEKVFRGIAAICL